jgi:hypothetical protein
MYRPIFLLLLAAGVLPAQSFFPFTFDQDNLQGAPDYSFLNHPLTPADRIMVRDGHFFTIGPDLLPNTPDDRRVRFFGANLAFGANFPTREDAPRIARRLRRLGINLVRLHHMDTSPDSPSNLSTANSLLTTGSYPSFNTVALTRLRDFLNALAAEGIYADLNLHVGYTFRPSADAVPALPRQSIPSQSKPFQVFHPRMVELQQQFTSELIARLQLRNDPVLAMVEVNNESSLVQAWQWNQLDPVLDGEYRTSLQQQWNRWLAGHYPTTDALSTAWGPSTADGADILPGRWTLEQGHGKTGSIATTTTDGIATAQVTPGQGSGWLFLKQTGFKLTAGTRYLWRFEARTDLPAGQSVSVPVTVMRDVSPWDGTFSSTIKLTSEWQTFTFAVTPGFHIQDSGRVSLDVEFAPGNVYARNMTLVPAGRRGLAPGESLDDANIALLSPAEGASPARISDYTSFLIATDRAYVNQTRDTVHAAADPLVPVTGTQMGYGGLAILDTQDSMDYQDNHFYIDHYNFPNTAWDAFDWRIRDSAAGDSGWSNYLDMAWSRQAGRPFTVSEFNQPWPNTHAAELDPSLAAFAAFQDWDAIMHFAYSHGRGWDDGVPNGFNINGDWTKFAGIGQSAWIFRTGAVQPSTSPLTVPVSAAERLQSAAAAQSITTWVTARAGLPKDAALTHAVQLAPDSSVEMPKPPNAPGPSELAFDTAGKRIVLAAPMAAGVFGSIGTAKVSAGALDFELAPGSRGFAALLVTAQDNRPISQSSRLLLSLPGYSLRNAQPLIHYPGTTDWWTVASSTAKPSGDLNTGHGPTVMEKVEGWITLRTSAVSITVTPLDGAGRPTTELPASDVVPVSGGFRIHLNAASPWYTITALHRPPRRR